jgi:hypothetical protein
VAKENAWTGGCFRLKELTSMMILSITILILTALATVLGILNAKYKIETRTKIPYLAIIKKRPNSKLTIFELVIILIVMAAGTMSMAPAGSSIPLEPKQM